MGSKKLQEEYLKNRSNLYDYLIMHIKDHCLTEDLLQDLFVKISRPDFSTRVIKDPNAYLFILLRNMIIDYWRSAARSKRISEEFWKNQQHEQLVFNYPGIEQDKLVIFNYIFKVLTPQQKEIFLLHRADGLSYQEIADKLKLSKSTIKNHMVAALKKIRIEVSKRNLINYIWPIFVSNFI